MRKLFSKIVALIITLSLPCVALAGSVSLNSDTYYAISVEEIGSDSRNIGTLYEYLSLNATEIGNSNISFVFNGWGNLETSNNRIYTSDDEKERSDGNVSTAYFDYSGDSSNLNIRVGKQPILSGNGYEGISGLSIRSDLPYNFRVSAYTGVPEELEEKSASGDLASGGRIAFKVPEIAEVGVGYLEETDNQRQFRREESADLWIAPVSMMEVYGKVVRNAITEENSYGSVSANIYPMPKITLSAKYDKAKFEDYFTNSELAVFNEIFTNNDELASSGGNVTYNANELISVSIDFKEYNFKEGRGATAYGANYTVNGKGGSGGLSYHKTDSRDDNKNSFDEYRVYKAYNIEKVSISCDVIFDHFEKEMGGRHTSTSVIVSAGYKVADNLTLAADLDASRTPEYDENYKAFIRANYNFESK